VNLDNDLRILSRHGRVAVIGNRGRIEIDPRMTMAKESSIVGVAAWASESELAEIHAYLVAGLGAGTLRPVVGERLSLKDAAKAHDIVMKSGSYGKIVLIP
jgi:NADPH2:quinone reductase